MEITLGILVSATTRRVISRNSNITYEEVCCATFYGVYNGNWNYCHYKNSKSAEAV